MFFFAIPTHKIPAGFLLFLFWNVLTIYAAGSDRVNHEPNLTPETRIEIFWDRVDSRVCSLVECYVGSRAAS